MRRDLIALLPGMNHMCRLAAPLGSTVDPCSFRSHDLPMTTTLPSFVGARGARKIVHCVRLEVTSSPRAILAVTTVLATRHADVVRLEVGPVLGDRRLITLEIRDTLTRASHLAKYLNRSVDVIRVFPPAERAVVCRASLMRVSGTATQMANAIALSQAFGAVAMQIDSHECVLCLVATDDRLQEWSLALGAFRSHEIATSVLMPVSSNVGAATLHSAANVW